jgi:hypothetical protein
VYGFDRTPGRNYIEGQQVSCVQAHSNSSSCGELCIAGFRDENCMDSAGVGFHTVLSDTSGEIKPLIWPNSNDPELLLGCLSYSSPTTENFTDCKPLQFTFYGPKGLSVGVRYMTPGQTWESRFSFSIATNQTVTGYSGVTMLESVPADELSDYTRI